jgi:hypothetical protein
MSEEAVGGGKEVGGDGEVGGHGTGGKCSGKREGRETLFAGSVSLHCEVQGK